MQKFEFYTPTKIIFGKDTEKAVGRQIVSFGGSRVLMLSGSKSARESGLLGRVEDSMKEAGLTFFAIEGVQPNPVYSLVLNAVGLCRKENIDFILAVGGGSVIDTAKAVAMGAADPDADVWEDFYLSVKTPKAALPVASVLTIAAAGSEMSFNSVITNEDGKIKRGFKHEKLRPKFAIMNPELTYTLPKYQTAAGCADILMHTFERFFVPTTGNGVTDLIALAVLKTVIKFAPVVCEKPEDYEARSEIMWAGSLSHNTITGLGAEEDWASHQMSHELSGMYGATHGAGLTAVWGHWARFVYKNIPERFAWYGAEVFGLPRTEDAEKDALSAIAATEEFFGIIDMPCGLRELLGKKATEAEIEELAERCSFGRKRTVGSVIKLGCEEIKTIYTNANA